MEKRDKWIDFLKGIAIIAMIAGHIIGGLNVAEKIRSGGAAAKKFVLRIPYANDVYVQWVACRKSDFRKKIHFFLGLYS